MATPDPGDEPSTDDRRPTALPSVGARVLAFACIILAGFAGGIIGYGFTDLQCTGDCTVQTGVGGLVGAVIGALGTAVVVVLALRAMGEWRTVQERQAPSASPDRRPPRVR